MEGHKAPLKILLEFVLNGRIVHTTSNTIAKTSQSMGIDSTSTVYRKFARIISSWNSEWNGQISLSISTSSKAFRRGTEKKKQE